MGNSTHFCDTKMRNDDTEKDFHFCRTKTNDYSLLGSGYFCSRKKLKING